MPNPLGLDDEAIEELDAAAAWYEARRDHLGAEFIAAVRDALAAISRSPQAWPRYPGADVRLDVRAFVLRRFPYVIVYLDLADEIRVLAIAHSSREPGFWRGRL